MTKTFSVGFFGRKRMVRALKNVSLKVPEGQTCALVGESGSGKTTVGKIATGLLSADEGTILAFGQPLNTYKPKEKARLIQMVFQDPSASLNPKLTVGSQILEALTSGPDKLNPREKNDQAEKILAEVGLPKESLRAYAHQFSGGQKQRIAIARALAPQPKILILDEPVSALDLSIQAQILNLLMEIQSKRRLTYLFISHDLLVVECLADTIVVMSNGEVVESGPMDAIFKNPQSPYTKKLLDATLRGKTK